MSTYPVSGISSGVLSVEECLREAGECVKQALSQFHLSWFVCLGRKRVHPLLTLSLPQPVKFRAVKMCMHTPAGSLCSGPMKLLLSILGIIIEILIRANAKRTA